MSRRESPAAPAARHVAAEAASCPTRWSVVAVAVCAGIIGGFHIGKVPPALPIIRAELDASLVAGGWIMSMFAMTAAIIGAFTGMLADRVGHRRLMLWGVAICSLGSLLGAAAPNPTMMLVTRFIEGIGFVSIIVSAPALIVQATAPHKRNLTIGLWSVYMPSGMGLALALSPLALPALGWRGEWIALGLLGFACLAVAVPVTASAGRTVQAGLHWRDVRATLARPGPWLIAVCFLTYVMQWTSLTMWLPTFLTEQRQADTTTAALLTALVVASNMIGNLGGAWMLHRGVPRNLLIAGCLIAIGVMAQGIFLASLPDGVRFGLCIVFSAISGAVPASVLASAPAHAATPRQIGVTNGMIVQGSNIGQTLGPPLVAAVVTAAGVWEAAGWLMGALAVAGVALSFAVAAVERRMRPAA